MQKLNVKETILTMNNAEKQETENQSNFEVDSNYGEMPSNLGYVSDSENTGKDRIDAEKILDETVVKIVVENDENPNPGSKTHSKDFSEDTSRLMSVLVTISSQISKSYSSLSFRHFSNLQSKNLKDIKSSQHGELLARSFGLLLAFISGVLMTAYSSMIKMLDSMDSMQVVVVRGLIQFLVMLTVAQVKNISIKCGYIESYKTVVLLLLVAVTGGLRLLFVFTSFSRLPLGDSTTILFSSPVIVMVLSVFVLHEKCGVFRLVAASGLISGVILIAKPPIIFGSDHQIGYDALGYSLVLCACLMSALGIVLTKLISKQVEKVVILLYLGLAAIICGTIGLVTFGQPSLANTRDWVLAIIIGLLGMVQQYLLVWAVQLESPARVTVVRQFQIVLAYLVQVVMFGVMPTWTDMLGAGLVLVTVISIPFENFINSKLCSTVQETVEVDGNKDSKKEKS